MIAPGLKRRRRKDGSVAWYWAASVSGFEPRLVRLHGTEDEIAARCHELTAEQAAWKAAHDEPTFAGTIASLIDCYRRDVDSPYRAVKGNTRASYEDALRILETEVGRAKVASLTRKDFARWFRDFGAGDRPRRAANCMKMARIIIRFGRSMRYEGCREAAEVLSDMRFAGPERRVEAVSFDQAQSIVRAAIASGRVSVALGQALQFECSLRQKDVIGEWTDAAPQDGGIVHRGKRWSGGLLWSDISPDGILTKRTTKTAAVGEWNLALCPLVTEALAAVPADQRVGPMIVSEATWRPYVAGSYAATWRAFADAAGVPRSVWNMDSRAGGITEGSEAGAEVSDLQHHATHSSPKMTSRYIRETLASTERVARLRMAKRKG